MNTEMCSCACVCVRLPVIDSLQSYARATAFVLVHVCHQKAFNNIRNKTERRTKCVNDSLPCEDHQIVINMSKYALTGPQSERYIH